MTDKVRENRLRRMAARRGLQLVKSRRRDPGAWDFQTYALIDPFLNSLVFGDPNSGFGKSLDEIEGFMTGPNERD